MWGIFQYLLITAKYMLATLILSSDEMLFSSLLVIKGYLSNIGDYLALTYTAGILVGSIIWRMIIRCSSVRKVMFISQLGLFFSTIILPFLTSPQWLLFFKFLQGGFVTAPAICINLFAKMTLKTNQFNRFLAITQVCTSIIEGFIPALNEYLILRYGIIAGMLLPAVYILIGLPYVCLERRYRESRTVVNAIRDSFEDYSKILSSILIIPLFIVGLTNGIADVFVLHISDNMVAITYPFISIGSFVVVNLAAHFSKNEDGDPNKIFNWKAGIINDDRKKIYLSLAVVFIAVLTFFYYKLQSTISFIIFAVILLSSTNVINYLATKSLYCIYYSGPCIASSIILVENLFSCIIQAGYKYIVKEECLLNLIRYLSVFLFATFIAITAFYIVLDQYKHKERALNIKETEKNN